MPEDTFPGLGYHGVTPDARIETWADNGRRLWATFETTLPPHQRDLLGTSADPWRDGSATTRARAVGVMADTFVDLAAALMDRVLDPELPYDLPNWRADLTSRGQAMQAAAVLVQHGGDPFAHERTRRRLSAAAANLEIRLAELARRAGLDPDHPEAISHAQARAWAASSGRGLVRTAGQIGAAAHFENQPVRRILTAFEDHCATCPGKALTYDSLEDCITACGGWPGDGSDQCHGNCLCALEPASSYSVFGDDAEAILAGGDRGPVEPPPPGAPLSDQQVVELLARELAPLVGEPVEHLIIWAITGRELARVVGDESSVRLPAGDWQGAIIGHTHPWDPERPLYGLDPDDLAIFASHQVGVGTVSYRWGDRTYVQVLRSMGDGWPDAVDLAEALRIEFVRARSLQRRGRLRTDEDPMHIALERVATQFRLSYRRTEAGL